MINIFLKRTAFFLATLILSFFLPWQLTALILLAAALFVPTPIEYIFLVIGVFQSSIFTLIWFLVVAFGLLFRDRVRINIF